MAESDSPLSTTSSIIAILTLVYALTITLQIYVTALYRSEHETEALAQRLGHGEHGINEMRMTLERFAAAHGYYNIETLERSLEAGRAWHPQRKQDQPTASDDLRILADKIKAAEANWKACVNDWQSFQNDLRDAHWGVFGSAKYATISDPLWGIIVWPLAFHRAFASCVVQTAVSTLLWLIAVVLVVPLGSIWLAAAILYNLFVLMYNGLVWLDLKHLVQRLKWTTKQGDIARRMLDVESTIADLRMQVLVRSQMVSEDMSLRMARETLQSMHDHFERLIEIVVDPQKARAIFEEKRKEREEDMPRDHGEGRVYDTSDDNETDI